MESTLTLKKSDLQGSVGLFLGWGRGTANVDTAWDRYQEATLKEVVDSGYRQFLYPPVLEGERGSYDWSFLKPTASVPLAAAASTVVLPDDFGGFEGRVSLLSTAQSTSWWPLELRGEGEVRQRHSENPSTTGRPQLAALVPEKGTGATQGQRFHLLIWPVSDQAYTLQAQYYLLPDCLSDAFPYCYGGAAHTETILESCLAIAEQRLDDASAVHTQKFMERLQASISLDRRNKPQLLGYNADRSDARGVWPRGARWDYPPITVSGVQY